MNNDTISRQTAIQWVKTECNPYGKPTLDFESGKKVIEHLEQMPSVQKKTCKGCRHIHNWENEIEYGYPSPCTRCKRIMEDNYEK